MENVFLGYLDAGGQMIAKPEEVNNRDVVTAFEKRRDKGGPDISGSPRKEDFHVCESVTAMRRWLTNKIHRFRTG